MSDPVEASIAAALLAHLATFAAAQSPVISIAQPNVVFTPQAQETFLEPFILPAQTVNVGISDQSSTEIPGIFQVTIVAPSGGGIMNAMRIAGSLVEAFERDTVLLRDGVTVKVDGRPTISPSLQESERLRLPVRVRYYALI